MTLWPLIKIFHKPIKTKRKEIIMPLFIFNCLLHGMKYNRFCMSVCLSGREHVRVRVNCIKLMRIHFIPRPIPINMMPFKSRFNLIFIVVVVSSWPNRSSTTITILVSIIIVRGMCGLHFILIKKSSSQSESAETIPRFKWPSSDAKCIYGFILFDCLFPSSFEIHPVR